MTPAARISAAIEILDQMNDGLAAEQALTRWSRNSRFAGSKDRAAVRDHVFDVLRQRRSVAHFGGAETGRGLMLGLLRTQNVDPDEFFTGIAHAPAPLADYERAYLPETAAPDVAWDLQDWLIPDFEASLGPQARDTALALQHRAPICLRINTAKTDSSAAQLSLIEDGVETVPNPTAPHALSITGGPRRLRASRAYLAGEVELQDAASQSVVAELPPGARVLDYCAGGGGKSLALAMAPNRTVFAHDIDPRRMSDLDTRAERAGANITQLATQSLADHAPFDLVLCDAPCSGSGSWRRAAEAKWTLTPARLTEIQGIQDTILEAASALVSADGILAYVTCSVFQVENEARIDAFLARHPEWVCTYQRRYTIDENGDGFFAAHLTRS
ncbi:SAM-dependent methyltransferase [Sulfitobacter sp. SK012]|uniref:RsmB/NOP family class I SAM-dependent RNA methyltransferase n=1 Tax=Sulfitobacter sp. SK012 TaxID=1389005 RepID=UPI000E0A2DA2|nr:RsmB/NOP family class I SAM-dependent RNA methyltransferase [Sulfitobacter sp. SK012]AXI46618.1 SAM-dependent methyltransferase [Sulfitobacter sp. SK012]